MRIFRDKAWLKSFAGLTINLSAGYFAVPLIGTSFSIPKTFLDYLVLLADVSAGIIFLILTVKLERRLKK